MKERKLILELDRYEYGVVYRALNDKRTALLKDGLTSDSVDDLLLRVINLGEKKELLRDER